MYRDRVIKHRLVVDDCFVLTLKLPALWIALHCIALQCIAVHCSAFQCVAGVAGHCSALQCIAVHCRTL